MNQLEEGRFRTKVRVLATGCHEWIGARVPEGYGQMKAAGRIQYAHRLAYEHERGPIAGGMVIDHLCRNRACVNPDHLEVVTARENILRGVGPTAILARKTHCLRGHPLSGGNLYIRPSTGGRVCRACKNAHQNAAKKGEKL